MKFATSRSFLAKFLLRLYSYATYNMKRDEPMVVA
jgi:hypothetical protein